MQQTLSAYLFGFAVMNLPSGASDCFGRRPVVLVGLAPSRWPASAVRWLAASRAIFWRAVQGMSAGAGIVVSRAIIRDMYPPADAQRAMSQVTLFFGVAPAVAPMIGGLLFVHADWHSIFWFLAALGLALLLANARWLPETLHAQHKHPFRVGALLREYARLVSSPRFVLLVLASGIPFNGMFLYVLATPVFLGEHLQFCADAVLLVLLLHHRRHHGRAAVSGRLAGKVTPAAQIKLGFQVMVVISMLNIGLNLWAPLSAWWALPVLGLFAFGWAIMVPVVTLLVLDQVPERRGMASSLQACVGSAANGLVAGALVPLVMHSTHALAFTSAGLMCVGLVAWLIVHKRLKTWALRSKNRRCRCLVLVETAARVRSPLAPA